MCARLICAVSSSTASRKGKKVVTSGRQSSILRAQSVSTFAKCVPNYATSVPVERIRFFTRPERHKPLLTRSQNFVGHSAATCPAYPEPSFRSNCTLSLETLRNRGNRRCDLFFFSLRRLFLRFLSVGPAVSSNSWPSVSIAASHRVPSLDAIRK